MKDTFKEIYLNILYEQQGINEFDIQKYIDFLKNGKFFDKEGNIIEEEKNLLIDVPIELIEYCYENQNSLISSNKIKELLKNSKHVFNFKTSNDFSLYFSVFDFNDVAEIRSFHYRFFNINNEESMQNAIKYFSEYVKASSGFFNMFEKTGICIVDSYANILKVANHELGHFLQNTCNIRILKKDIINAKTAIKESDIEKLKHINITLNDFQYYTNAKEFYPHIDELILGLKKTYHKFYENLTLFSFFYDVVLNTIINEKSEEILKSDFVHKYIQANDNEYAALAMFIASYYLNIKFQKIRDLTYKSLKNKL